MERFSNEVVGAYLIGIATSFTLIVLMYILGMLPQPNPHPVCDCKCLCPQPNMGVR